MEFLVTDGLKLAVLCGIDAQAAAVHGPVRLIGGIALFGNEGIHDLVNQSIFIIGINAVVFIGCVDEPDACIHIILKRGFMLIGSDVALFFHIAQHDRCTAVICLRIADRIITGRVLRDGSKHGSFRKRELGDILVKIAA